MAGAADGVSWFTSGLRTGSVDCFCASWNLNEYLARDIRSHGSAAVSSWVQSLFESKSAGRTVINDHTIYALSFQIDDGAAAEAAAVAIATEKAKGADAADTTAASTASRRLKTAAERRDERRGILESVSGAVYTFLRARGLKRAVKLAISRDATVVFDLYYETSKAKMSAWSVLRGHRGILTWGSFNCSDVGAGRGGAAETAATMSSQKVSTKRNTSICFTAIGALWRAEQHVRLGLGFARMRPSSAAADRESGSSGSGAGGGGGGDVRASEEGPLPRFSAGDEVMYLRNKSGGESLDTFGVVVAPVTTSDTTSVATMSRREAASIAAAAAVAGQTEKSAAASSPSSSAPRPTAYHVQVRVDGLETTVIVPARELVLERETRFYNDPRHARLEAFWAQFRNELGRKHSIHGDVKHNFDVLITLGAYDLGLIDTKRRINDRRATLRRHEIISLYQQAESTLNSFEKIQRETERGEAWAGFTHVPLTFGPLSGRSERGFIDAFVPCHWDGMRGSRISNAAAHESDTASFFVLPGRVSYHTREEDACRVIRGIALQPVINRTILSRIDPDVEMMIEDEHIDPGHAVTCVLALQLYEICELGMQPYTTKSGETSLAKVSESQGVPMKELRDANPAVSRAIEVGQILQLPRRLITDEENRPTVAIRNIHIERIETTRCVCPGCEFCDDSLREAWLWGGVVWPKEGGKRQRRLARDDELRRRAAALTRAIDRMGCCQKIDSGVWCAECCIWGSKRGKGTLQLEQKLAAARIKAGRYKLSAVEILAAPWMSSRRAHTESASVLAMRQDAADVVAQAASGVRNAISGTRSAGSGGADDAEAGEDDEYNSRQRKQRHRLISTADTILRPGDRDVPEILAAPHLNPNTGYCLADAAFSLLQTRPPKKAAFARISNLTRFHIVLAVEEVLLFEQQPEDDGSSRQLHAVGDLVRLDQYVSVQKRGMNGQLAIVRRVARRLRRGLVDAQVEYDVEVGDGRELKGVEAKHVMFLPRQAAGTVSIPLRYSFNRAGPTGDIAGRGYFSNLDLCRDGRVRAKVSGEVVVEWTFARSADDVKQRRSRIPPEVDRDEKVPESDALLMELESTKEVIRRTCLDIVQDTREIRSFALTQRWRLSPIFTSMRPPEGFKAAPPVPKQAELDAKFERMRRILLANEILSSTYFPSFPREISTAAGISLKRLRFIRLPPESSASRVARNTLQKHLEVIDALRDGIMQMREPCQKMLGWVVMMLVAVKDISPFVLEDKRQKARLHGAFCDKFARWIAKSSDFKAARSVLNALLAHTSEIFCTLEDCSVSAAEHDAKRSEWRAIYDRLVKERKDLAKDIARDQIEHVSPEALKLAILDRCVPLDGVRVGFTDGDDDAEEEDEDGVGGEKPDDDDDDGGVMEEKKDNTDVAKESGSGKKVRFTSASNTSKKKKKKKKIKKKRSRAAARSGFIALTVDVQYAELESRRVAGTAKKKQSLELARADLETFCFRRLGMRRKAGRFEIPVVAMTELQRVHVAKLGAAETKAERGARPLYRYSVELELGKGSDLVFELHRRSALRREEVIGVANLSVDRDVAVALAEAESAEGEEHGDAGDGQGQEEERRRASKERPGAAVTVFLDVTLPDEPGISTTAASKKNRRIGRLSVKWRALRRSARRTYAPPPTLQVGTSRASSGVTFVNHAGSAIRDEHFVVDAFDAYMTEVAFERLQTHREENLLKLLSHEHQPTREEREAEADEVEEEGEEDGASQESGEEKGRRRGGAECAGFRSCTTLEEVCDVS